jgi:hypothetical protein
VESKVGYYRRNWLVPMHRSERLSDFNQDLLTLCDAEVILSLLVIRQTTILESHPRYTYFQTESHH